MLSKKTGNVYSEKLLLIASLLNGHPLKTKQKGLNGEKSISNHSKANICNVEKLIIANLLTIHGQLQLSDFHFSVTVLTL